MRFAHIADCHIGGWRDPKLRDVSTNAFIKAIDVSVEKCVDFILIAGDLFNTSLPAVDRLKAVVLKLKELKDKGIPVYIVPGSHDFSPSGKTMLDVLDGAGLCINVVKGDVQENGKLRLRFTVDTKTGAKITGMLGKRGMLERKYYEDLERDSLENEDGFKIFMFHTAIDELKPKELERMTSAPASLLPKGFNYYAGGHVHIVGKFDLDNYCNLVYPGPLFPNNFLELEKLKRGGFYIYDDGKITFEPIQIYNIECFEFDCDYKDAKDVEGLILNKIKEKEFFNTIVTLRLKGKLKSGKPSEINFKSIFSELYGRGAYFVMKSTTRLITEDFEEVKIETNNPEDIEGTLIDEHVGQISVKGMDVNMEKELIKNLISSLSSEKLEGERVVDYEDRLKKNISELIKTKL